MGLFMPLYISQSVYNLWYQHLLSHLISQFHHLLCYYTNSITWIPRTGTLNTIPKCSHHETGHKRCIHWSQHFNSAWKFIAKDAVVTGIAVLLLFAEIQFQFVSSHAAQQPLNTRLNFNIICGPPGVTIYIGILSTYRQYLYLDWQMMALLEVKQQRGETISCGIP